MAGTEEQSLSACLLQWVRSFDGRIERYDDLSDGITLCSILHEIDSAYFAETGPEPEVESTSDWTRKWQNLKHVERQLSTYYRDVCSGQEHVNPDCVPNLKAIATEASHRDLEKVIMLIIRAAMASPESNQKMAQRLMSLGRDNAMVIASELRNMEEAEVSESEPASRDESAYQSEQEALEEPRTNGTKTRDNMYQDPLLEREEVLLQAQATIDRLQANQAAAQRQLQELREDKERLQEAFDIYRHDIDSKGRKSGGDDAFKKLQRQTENDKAYIDDLESQMQSSRSTIENYERQLQRQKDEADASQKLRDDLQMLQAENEELNQKVKANENLKKKIQTLQEHEKANATLREEIKQANERLEELDRLKQMQAGLEKEIIEKKGLIRNQEYQITELTTTRKHAEYDARVLAQKLQDARERNDRSQEAIEELTTKLQDSTIGNAQTDEVSPETNGPTPFEEERKSFVPKNDESKNLAEKLALVEQQLETADARLQQASERNAKLEEQQRGIDLDAEARHKAEQQAQEHEMTIANLRKELETSSKQKVEAVPPAQDMAALQRENHLMATAWYDLSSRIQNNGVALGRRRQEPKSWIGKQRALVSPASGMVSTVAIRAPLRLMLTWV